MAGDDHGGGVEWLGIEDGAEVLDTAPPRRHRWPRWTPLILLVVVGVVVALVVAQDNSGTPAAAGSSLAPASPRATSRAASTHAPTPVIPTTFGPAAPTRPSVIRVGHPILGIAAGYELFARGPGGVVRVQFAQGRITTTGLPPRQGGEPMFLVGAHAAIVRSPYSAPDDAEPGYLIPDRGAPTKLTGLLAHTGRIFPGPDPAHLWVERDTHSLRGPLRLVDFDGMPTSTRIRVPSGFFVTGSDGAGYVLASGPGGIYGARPSGLTRITHGALLAVGPSGWLARECDRHAHCASVYIDRTSGSRLALDDDIDADASGVIAPDGSTAALFESGDAGAVALHIIDLSSGADRSISLPSVGSEGYGGRQLAWSPDGRWLFVAGNSLRAIDMRTHRMHVLKNVAPELVLSQVAIRSATM